MLNKYINYRKTPISRNIALLHRTIHIYYTIYIEICNNPVDNHKPLIDADGYADIKLIYPVRFSRKR